MMFKGLKIPCPVEGCDYLINADSLAEGVLNSARHYVKEHEEELKE